MEMMIQALVTSVLEMAQSSHKKGWERRREALRRRNSCR